MTVRKIRKTDNKKSEMLEALEKHLGVVTTAAKAVNISREAHYSWYQKDPKYKAAVDALGDVALDFVESKLFANISSGDVASTLFYLKTKGKKRGYIERQELTGADGKELQSPRVLTREEVKNLYQDLERDY